jgi:hypothetical protein
MQRVAIGQLSFDARPGSSRVRPDMVTISVAGKFGSEQLNVDGEDMPQLSHGERVMVVLSDADGQLIAKAEAHVEIGFATDKDGITSRLQKVKL